MKSILRNICIIIFLIGSAVYADVGSSVSGWSFSSDSVHAGLVRIRISTVHYSAVHPWSREVGSSYDVTGIVLDNHRILMSAGPLKDAVNIEVMRHGSYRKFEGHILVSDLEANLAMITVSDESFFDGLKAIPLSADPSPGNAYRALRIDGNFNIESNDVTVSEIIPVADYGFTRLPVAVFRSAPRFEAGGLILDGNGLVGMIGFVDGQDQAEAVFASRLKRFQEMVAEADGNRAEYAGFPVQGFFFSPLEDPALRDYYGLKDNQDGVLITTVLAECSVSDSLKPGDVLLSVDGFSVNPAGQYKDKKLGLQSMDLLFVRDGAGNVRRPGDSLELKIVREGKEQTVNVPLRAYRGGAERIPWWVDGPPDYLVHNGLIFVELSVPFLKERFGGDWKIRALALAASYDSEKYYAPGEEKDRVIVISDTLPSDSVVGYERSTGEQVVEINGKKANSLAELRKVLESNDGIATLKLKSGRMVYLRTGKGDPALRENYGIPEKSRIRKN
ncbi:MAG: hypothetical protein KDK37_03540 [Leptospiraceae bacterium]|nr:hypothetical protein [Leptospiraceae bacterium]